MRSDTDGLETAERARTRLSRGAVFRAAVELADREGLEALTMRRLAEELGVGVMSLYHYVPNKDELITGMIDLVFGEIALPATEGEWRGEMRRRGLSTRDALKRHRWAVGRMESHRMPGLASFRAHDAALGCLREAGFTVEDAIQALSVQDAYIYGFALQEATLPFDDAAGAAALAGEQAREYSSFAAGEGLGALAEEFPYLAEVVGGYVAQAGYDFETAFEYGLDLILDGLDARRGNRGARRRA